MRLSKFQMADFHFWVNYPFKVEKLLQPIYIKNTKMTFQYIIVDDDNMWRAHYMLLML